MSNMHFGTEKQLNSFSQTMDSSDWNMSHFFHAMLAVEFQQGTTLSQSRRDADKQLSSRISDPMLRAWLLMNMMEDEETGEVGWRINIENIYNGFLEHIGERNKNIDRLICKL